MSLILPSSLPSAGYLRINSETGLIQLVSGGTEQGFAYHDYGYITLAPNDQTEFAVLVGHTAGSQEISTTDTAPNLYNRFLYIDGVWRKVNRRRYSQDWTPIGYGIDSAA